MYACKYVCVCIYVCMQVCMCMYVCVRMYADAHLEQLQLSNCIHTYIYIHTSSPCKPLSLFCMLLVLLLLRAVGRGAMESSFSGEHALHRRKGGRERDSVVGGGAGGGGVEESHLSVVSMRYT